jgi:hypothetical protein
LVGAHYKWIWLAKSPFKINNMANVPKCSVYYEEYVKKKLARFSYLFFL